MTETNTSRWIAGSEASDVETATVAAIAIAIATRHSNTQETRTTVARTASATRKHSTFCDMQTTTQQRKMHWAMLPSLKAVSGRPKRRRWVCLLIRHATLSTMVDGFETHDVCYEEHRLFLKRADWLLHVAMRLFTRDADVLSDGCTLTFPLTG